MVKMTKDKVSQQVEYGWMVITHSYLRNLKVNVLLNP